MSNWPAISDIAKQVKSGKLKASDLVETALKNLEAKQEYQTVIEITAERARERASKSDALVAQGGEAGRLAGVPFIAKDNFLAYGAKTTASSNILKPFEAPYQATAIERLEAEGAILIAKSNLDAFAHGSSTENSDFFVTKNPHDKTRVPGGSSGGSAAAVALDIVPFALGTDTGGSIRQPASLCSITGLKPTYGRVSRAGIIAMASSLDQAGPITKTVEDAAILLKYMSGHDKLDSTSSKKEVPDYKTSLKSKVEGLKIGIPKEFFGAGLDPKVRKIIEDAIAKYKELGAEIIDVSLPMIKYALAVYYILMPAEVSSNLAKFDGIRFGHSVLKSQVPSPKSQVLEEVYSKSRAEGFGTEAKRRIMLGSYVLSAGYYDAYYKKALKVRALIKKEFDEIFKQVDILATPVTPTPAFKFGEKTADPLTMYLEDVMTVPINPAGIPAMSIPAGFTKDKLPVGLQLIGPMWGEQAILNAGYAFQEVTEHHLKKPEIE